MLCVPCMRRGAQSKDTEAGRKGTLIVSRIRGRVDGTTGFPSLRGASRSLDEAGAGYATPTPASQARRLG